MAPGKRTSARIVLVQSPPWSHLMPPLGLAYLATYLRQNGIAAEVFDLNIGIYRDSEAVKKNRTLRDLWFNEETGFWVSGRGNEVFRRELADAARQIALQGCDIIGISVVGNGLFFANELIGKIKALAPTTTVVVGGGAAAVRELRVLFGAGRVDYFVAGEGERPLLGIIKKIRAGDETFLARTCTVFKDNDAGPTCIAVQGDPDLNLIPYPTFEEFDLALYEDQLSLPIIGSKGCVNRCVFCQDCRMFPRYICRDPDNIAAEMRYHAQRYQNHHRVFVDLMINGDSARLKAMCACLAKEKTDVRWSGLAAVRKDMTRQLIRDMREAGCDHIVFGCESFSSDLLRLMRKGFSPDDARRCLGAASESGITKIDINLIAGFPGERDAHVDETLAFVKENRASISAVGNIGLLKILPGSFLSQHPEEFNIEPASIGDPLRWHTKDHSSTYEKRCAAGRRYVDALAEFGVPIDKDPDGLARRHQEDDAGRLISRKAILFIGRKEYSTAGKVIAEGLAQAPASYHVAGAYKRLLAEETALLLGRSEYRAAAQKIEEGLARFPGDEGLTKLLHRRYVEEAGWLFRARKHAAAVRLLNDVRSRFPQSRDLLRILEHTYSELGRWSDAENICEEMLRLDQEDNEIRFRLGRIWLHQGRLERASGAFRELLARGYTHRELFNEMGLVSLKQKQYAQAESELTRGASLYPDNPYLALNLGFALLYQHKHRRAQEQFERALSLDARIADAHAGIGFVCLDREKYAEAKTAFLKAYRCDKHSIRALTGLGHLFSLEGDYHRAAEKFKAAIDADGRIPEIYLSLEDVLTRCGDTKGAARWRKKAVVVSQCLAGETAHADIR